jgi:hypothetical protein
VWYDLDERFDATFQLQGNSFCGAVPRNDPAVRRGCVRGKRREVFLQWHRIFIHVDEYEAGPEAYARFG